MPLDTKKLRELLDDAERLSYSESIALLDALEAAELDAKRYRWLRLLTPTQCLLMDGALTLTFGE